MKFEKSEPVTSFAKTNMLIYGFPKIGKTSFAAQFVDEKKEPLFIMTEEGTGMLKVFSQRVTSWEGFKRYVGELEKNVEEVQKKFNCIIIDLVSDLDTWCARSVAQQLHIQHISDADYGKGFALHREAFQEQIQKLFAILPCTFIAHSQEKEIQWQGEKLKMQAPSLSKGGLEYINGKVDSMLWFVPENSKNEFPKVTLKPSTRSVAGSRFPQIAKEYKYDFKSPVNTYNLIQKDFLNK